jgi:hypothetical protein
MRRGIGIASLIVLGLSLGVAFSQEEGKKPETRTVAGDPTPRGGPISIDRMWHYHYEGKVKKGSFLELAKPDAEDEGKGRTLIITQLDVRTAQGMRWQLVEHRKAGKEWKKILRRSELFSQGWYDGTSKTMVSNYWGWIGMMFGHESRPSMEFTQGSGDIAVYGEGYWAD